MAICKLPASVPLLDNMALATMAPAKTLPSMSPAPAVSVAFATVMPAAMGLSWSVLCELERLAFATVTPAAVDAEIPASEPSTMDGTVAPAVPLPTSLPKAVRDAGDRHSRDAGDRHSGHPVGADSSSEADFLSADWSSPF